MAFDYKKEYKEFYLPPRKPGIVTVPPMNFVSVQGRGTETGQYRRLYAGAGGRDPWFRRHRTDHGETNDI